jgi:hypothetical protein
VMMGWVWLLGIPGVVHELLWDAAHLQEGEGKCVCVCGCAWGWGWGGGDIDAGAAETPGGALRAAEDEKRRRVRGGCNKTCGRDAD